jgi:ADP-ribose pyrophosphatase
MHVSHVRKLTDEKWLNLFEAAFEHNGHSGRWVFASRKADPGADRDRPDAVVIVPVLLADGQPPRLVLLREFRVPVNGYLYAFPAGLLEEGEPVEECVRRELAEETGLEVVRVKRVTGPLYSTAGLTDESAAMAFVDVRAVDGVGPRLDASEDLEAVLLDHAGLRQLCDDPSARFDAKCWTTLFLYRELGKLV